MTWGEGGGKRGLGLLGKRIGDEVSAWRNESEVEGSRCEVWRKWEATKEGGMKEMLRKSDL